jgi:2-phosphoglycerate kinase
VSEPVEPTSGPLVTARGSGLPFSKGVLAQSLLAAAMDPTDAFAIALHIEEELVSSGDREITRDALRAFVSEVLRNEKGDESAERYLLWRRDQESDFPLILLLGGTSGVGKSALALEVARRLGIGRVLSTDSIRQVMRVLLSREMVPALYGSSYDAHALLPVEDGVRPDVIAGFRAQASGLAVGIRACLDRTVDESSHLVVDGVSIAPGLIDLDAYTGRAHPVFFVVRVAPDELRNRLVMRATGQPRRLPDRYLANFDAILAIQDHLLARATRHGVPVIENVSLDESARLVIEHIMNDRASKLRARLPGKSGKLGE